MRRHFIYILFFLGTILLSGGSLYAQIVTGVVSDVNGPLPGVNIVVKGTTTGTATDFDGNYSIEVDKLIAVLVFSSIGYFNQEISVNGKDVINVLLVEDAKSLDEVVVIGYGTQKKSDVTGAVSVVDIETFDKTVSPFASQALQGLVSGVNVTANTGAPGDGAKVSIRGIGSVGLSSSPLFIVDGVPTQNAMDNLAPSDIESISVLKDGASAAIYGSRASNGVVIITTKKGKKGRAPKITLSSLYSIQTHGELTKMANRDQYIEVYNEAAVNDNLLLPNNPELHRRTIDAELAASLPDVDHLESIFRTAALEQYTVGVSGGTEKTSYNLSGSYFKQEGILLGSDYNRVTGKANINTEVNDWLNAGVNINIYRSKNQIVASSGDGFGGNGGGAVRYALFRTPGIPIYDANGDFVDLPDEPGFFGDGFNPVGVLTTHQNNLKKTNGVFGDVNLRFKLSDKFSFISTFGVDRSNFKQRRFDRTWGTSNRINTPNRLTVINNQIINSSFSNVLSYNNTINENHNISAIAGSESIYNTEEVVLAVDRDFADQSALLVQLGNGDGVRSTEESRSENKLLSFFGRVNYNYSQKFFFTLIGRRDGSSNFAKDNRWSNFYSGSLGWRISNEEFFENIDFIDKWMLRLGYGENGNQNIPPFSYLERIDNGFNYPIGGVNQSGNAIVAFGNALLKWETSQQIDIGTDLSFMGGKLGVTIDYFRKTSEGLLLPSPVPPSSGFATPAIINTGNLLNTGLELEVNYRNRVNDDFSYSLNANAAYLKNEILEINAPVLAGRIDNNVFATKTEVGQPVGSFFLYEMDGIFQNELEIFTSATPIGSNILPGDVKYKDKNGDGVITDLDRSHVGSPLPDVTFGFNADLNYRDIDFSMFVAGAVGQEIYYQVATDIEGFYRPFNITKRYYDERWTGEGTSNTQPRASWRAKSNNTRPSTRFLEDGSFVRLKNVQLGYTIPKETIRKFNVDKFRIYVSASNLITLTKYPGLDPEQTTSDNSTSEGALASNIDWGTYPTAVSMSLGLQLKF
ncbi:SusC/RagA family TonB-linked outer membrane protein [Ulvibacterium marinum]|uniref:SusC/RagA family TonB-linked outer membrane protein n=1 Tax=Ulvibacterium marinum TaxID=2419782 RepID=UPI002494320A|nr:TonB-dependent receptor [Ulvibacterium marinum]